MCRKVKLPIPPREGLDFLTLAIGSMLGQGLAIVFAPILSRIYTEEQMGTYTLILTAVGMFESSICLRYDLIIVSEKKDNRIRSIAHSCLKISLLLSCIITFTYSLYLLLSGQLPLNKTWMGAMVFPALVCGSIILILTAVNNRNKNYKNIALSSFSQGLVHNSLSTLLGLFHSFGVLGLILGRLGGYLSYIFVASRPKQIKELRKQELLSLKERFEILNEYKRQALFSTPACVIACVSYSIVNIFLSQLYGKSILGIYSYSYRLLGLPLIIISANISRMFLKNAAVEYHQKKTMRRTFLKMLVPVSIISLIMVIAFKLFAPSFFTFFLGSRWKDVGVFVQILAPMYGIRLLSNSFSNATIIVNKQFIALALQFLYLIASATVFIICRYQRHDVFDFLRFMNYLFCLIYAVYFMVIALLCLKIKRN